MSQSKAASFLSVILDSIEYLHANGICHRDLKPENMLLNKSESSLKLIDFGLSNTYKVNQQLNTACGSPCYAAPEMIAGKAYWGLQIDVWSCGIILYAMLVGYLPFEDHDTVQLYKKILACDYKIPPETPPDARDLITRILNVNP